MDYYKSLKTLHSKLASYLNVSLQNKYSSWLTSPHYWAYDENNNKNILQKAQLLLNAYCTTNLKCIWNSELRISENLSILKVSVGQGDSFLSRGQTILHYFIITLLRLDHLK